MKKGGLVSESALYRVYLDWLGHNVPASLQNLFDFPFINRDIYEDDSNVVNRLFYFVPDLSGATPRCFFFFEENCFSKDELGDLILLSSSFHTFES